MHQLVAAYLDYKAPAAREAESDQSLAALLGSMPAAAGAPKLDDSAWQQFSAARPAATEGPA